MKKIVLLFILVSLTQATEYASFGGSCNYLQGSFKDITNRKWSFSDYGLSYDFIGKNAKATFGQGFHYRWLSVGPVVEYSIPTDLPIERFELKTNMTLGALVRFNIDPAFVQVSYPITWMYRNEYWRKGRHVSVEFGVSLRGWE